MGTCSDKYTRFVEKKIEEKKSIVRKATHTHKNMRDREKGKEKQGVAQSESGGKSNIPMDGCANAKWKKFTISSSNRTGEPNKKKSFK